MGVPYILAYGLALVMASWRRITGIVVDVVGAATKFVVLVRSVLGVLVGLVTLSVVGNVVAGIVMIGSLIVCVVGILFLGGFGNIDRRLAASVGFLRVIARFGWYLVELDIACDLIG